jgi:hypothetical protein
MLRFGCLIVINLYRSVTAVGWRKARKFGSLPHGGGELDNLTHDRPGMREFGFKDCASRRTAQRWVRDKVTRFAAFEIMFRLTESYAARAAD